MAATRLQARLVGDREPAPHVVDQVPPECTHWIGAEKHHCKEVDGVRPYLTGPRCPAHTPAALQGKPEPPTGPGWPSLKEAQ